MLKPELKARWIAALRSGEYQQARGRIKQQFSDGKYGLCCLGVLCEITGREALVASASGFISSAVAKVLGIPQFTSEEIASYNNSSSVEANDSNSFQLRAASRNDSGMTFEEIADWLEKEEI